MIRMTLWSYTTLTDAAGPRNVTLPFGATGPWSPKGRAPDSHRVPMGPGEDLAEGLSSLLADTYALT